MSTQYNNLLDVVAVKNRVVDGRVRFLHNSVEYWWEPGEVKQMPRELAEWFVGLKSYFRLNPGDFNEGVPASREYKLVILGDGQDETDITREYVAGVKELLDVKNMPELTRVDPQTGLPMKRVYIDPRSTGAMANADAQKRIEDKVRSEVSKAMVSDGAEKIAEVVAQMPEAEFEAVVAELPADATQAPQIGTSRRAARA